MEKGTRGWTLGELTKLLQGSLDGPEHTWITGPSTTEGGVENSLAFAEDENYLNKAIASDVAAVITYKSAPASSKPYIRVDNPKQAFGEFLSLCQNSMPIAKGIHPLAVVSPDARVSEDASVGAYAVIEAGARVEADAKIYAFVYLGSNCVVGAGSILYPHAVLYSNVSVGERSIIHSNAVIGSDGFGFTWNGSRHAKIPHLGEVNIGSDVEIGAGTTIDRAMLGVTRIGDGAKIDNQVQIGHNCSIGENVVIVSQTGISGSSVIGDRCTLAGQVGIADHVTLTDDVIMTARSAVARDITEKGPLRGAPAQPLQEQLRLEASLRKVPQLLTRVKELERKLELLGEKDEA